MLLPLLMAYSLIGELFHEVTGTLTFLMFIIHQVLNRKWYGALLKGKYNVRRVFQTVLDLLLFVFMILQPLSGILMSKHLYIFLPVFSISLQARSIHMMLAYWGYVLLCIHAGTHLLTPFKKLHMKNKKMFATVCVAFGCVSVYGGLAFAKRDFWGYMSGKTAFAFFNYSEPRLLFFLDYLSIMALFMVIGYLAVYGLSKINTKR
jgi:hypothetical protein